MIESLVILGLVDDKEKMRGQDASKLSPSLYRSNFLFVTLSSISNLQAS
jgi:hypothetical protein